jgi:hypothetical protein
MVGTGTYPYNVAVSPTGAMYTSNNAGCVVYKYEGGTWTTFAGKSSLECQESGEGGLRTSAGIGATDGIAFDAAGNVYLADADYARVRRVTVADNKIGTYAGLGIPVIADDSAAVGAPLSGMSGIAVSPAGRIAYIEFPWSARIREVTTSGTLRTRGGNGARFLPTRCTLPCSAMSWSFASLTARPGDRTATCTSATAAGSRSTRLHRTTRCACSRG